MNQPNSMYERAQNELRASESKRAVLVQKGHQAHCQHHGTDVYVLRGGPDVKVGIFSRQNGGV